MHSMRIMQPTLGDEHVPWDPADPKSVAKARRKFNAAIKKGHRAFTVAQTPGEPITKFDPSLAEILLVAPLSGG